MRIMRSGKLPSQELTYALMLGPNPRCRVVRSLTHPWRKGLGTEEEER